MNEIELLESLSNYVLELGIFTSEGLQTVEVKIIDPDENIHNIKMKIADIMFFTEYGTIAIPGTFVLEKSLAKINELLNNNLSNLIDKILFKEIINELDIDNYFSVLCFKIEGIVKSYMQSVIKNNSRLNNILNQENNEDKYIYDLNKLSNYIKCRYFKKRR